jgi:hypothetical protein
MVEVLKDHYWSKSEAFLVPLTGLSKTQKYPMDSFLYWDDYSIDNFQLILRFKHDSREEFLKYCRKTVFPILDSQGHLIESYDFKDETIMILDISIWGMDIEMFLRGKYSKMSKDAKDRITEYHTFFDRGPKILIEILAALEPNQKYAMLGGQTAIEYVAENYGLPLDQLRSVGELGGMFDKEQETLIIEGVNKE